MSDAGSFLSNRSTFVLQKFQFELDSLRFTQSQKNEEAEMLFDAMQLIQARTKVIGDKIIVLKQELEIDDVTAASRQRSLNKLVKINKVLIETLDALELQPSGGRDKDLSKQMISLRSDLLPGIRPEGSDVVNKVATDMYTMNSKLKESTLIMSREYFASKKSMKATFNAYEKLRSEMRVVEHKNRTLQHDLDEIRKDDESNISMKIISRRLKNGEKSEDKSHLLEKRRTSVENEGERSQLKAFGATLSALLERQSLDALDTVKLFRRFCIFIYV
jgi:hypothetical protein